MGLVLVRGVDVADNAVVRGAAPAGQARTQLPELAVEAEDLARRFGAVEALAGASVSIRKGEFFSLLGPSGCGKTTLLRIVAGLDLPDRGSLRLEGQDALGVPAHLRPVNTVFQSYALFPHLTVAENVAFGLRMKRVPAAQRAARVQRVLDWVEIAGLAPRRPSQLSGGEKQRVALARAIVNEPAVLLLDEPLGALDLKLRRQLQLELHALQRRLGITFVHVTHDQEEALVMSDRLAVMNAGRLEQVGPPADVYEQPRTRFVAEFLGACNLIEGTIAEAPAAGAWLVQTALGPLRVAARPERAAVLPGRRLTLVIRPEKVRVLDVHAHGDQALAGVILDAFYLGAERKLRVRAGNVVLTASVVNAGEHGSALRPGAAVRFELPPSALVPLED